MTLFLRILRIIIPRAIMKAKYIPKPILIIKAPVPFRFEFRLVAMATSSYLEAHTLPLFEVA